jgi:transposase-like protein
MFTAEQKSEAVIKHVQDGTAVSDLCENFGIHPNQYYDWQKHAFSNLAATFRKEDTRLKALEKRLAKAHEKIARKDWAMGELLEEHIALKKNNGAT